MTFIITRTAGANTADALANGRGGRLESPLRLLTATPRPSLEQDAGIVQHAFDGLARNWGNEDLSVAINGEVLSNASIGLPEDYVRSDLMDKRIVDALKESFGTKLTQKFSWIQDDGERCRLGQYIATYLQNPGIPYLVDNALMSGLAADGGQGITLSDIGVKSVNIVTGINSLTISTHTAWKTHNVNFAAVEVGDGAQPVLTAESSITCEVRRVKVAGEDRYALDWKLGGVVLQTHNEQLAAAIKGEKPTWFEKLLEFCRTLMGDQYLTVRDASRADLKKEHWVEQSSMAQPFKSDPAVTSLLVTPSRNYLVDQVQIQARKPLTVQTQTVPTIHPSNALPEHVSFRTSTAKPSRNPIPLEVDVKSNLKTRARPDGSIAGSTGIRADRLTTPGATDSRPNGDDRKPVKQVTFASVVADPPSAIDV